MSQINVAIVGSPNCGKTTLFNLLAGTRYHVANYAGVTVERKFAELAHSGHTIVLHDLPGLYSLSSFAPDEMVTREFLINNKPDIVMHVIDASNLQRGLLLSLEIMELEIPLVLVLNMMDIVEKQGKTLNIAQLESNLKTRVIPISARLGKGVDGLLDAITNFDYSKKRFSIDDFSYGNDIDDALHDLTKENHETNTNESKFPSLRWNLLSFFESSLPTPEKHLGKLFPKAQGKFKSLESHFAATLDSDVSGVIKDHRHGMARAFMNKVFSGDSGVDKESFSDKLDKILSGRFLGPIILLGLLYILYTFVFAASDYPKEWIEHGIEKLSVFTQSHMPEGILQSLVISGIIQGVGSVLGFAPLIFFMFMVIGFLEDSGYLPRIAFILDRVFRIFGLQGNSVLPYIVSGGIAGGCAVPGVMAARTIKGKRERILTILTAPFMPCGAKLPVFALLVGAFFPGNKGLLMLLITLASWGLALLAAKIYSVTVLRGDASVFIMELPPYRLPTSKGLLIHAWDRTFMYIKKASTIILAASVLIWGVMTFPRPPSSSTNPTENNVALRSSIAGQIGTFMEPATSLAGFNWKTNVSLLAGFAAKEIVVSTMGTAYSLENTDKEHTESLTEKLQTDPAWSKASAIALILFTMLYSPCVVTVITIVRETKSILWGAFTIVANTALAYFMAVITYQLLKKLV